MRILLTGGSGMIGQGALRECLAREEVTEVLCVGRTRLEQEHPRLRQLIRAELYDWTGAEAELTGVDAALYCLGVSAGGMSEADYRKVTYDLAVNLATALVKVSPQARFCFISGAGTDSTGKGRTMWARVKGQTENALLAMGFKSVHCFRPGYIQPMDGIESKTPAYRRMYAVTTWLYPLLKGWKSVVTSTRQLGHALVEVALKGHPKPILESVDINAID